MPSPCVWFAASAGLVLRALGGLAWVCALQEPAGLGEQLPRLFAPERAQRGAQLVDGLAALRSGGQPLDAVEGGAQPRVGARSHVGALLPSSLPARCCNAVERAVER